MPSRSIRVRQHICARCGHTWIPRRDRPPKVCPVCKTRDWNQKLRTPATTPAAAL